MTLDALLDMLAAKIAEKTGAPSRRLMGINDAAEYLGITPAALRQWVASKKIPVVRVDRHMRFDVRDLDARIEAAKEA